MPFPVPRESARLPHNDGSTGWYGNGRRRCLELTNAITCQHSVERCEITRRDALPCRDHRLEIDARTRVPSKHTRRRREIAVVLRIELVHERTVHAHERRSRRAAATPEATTLRIAADTIERGVECADGRGHLARRARRHRGPHGVAKSGELLIAIPRRAQTQR